MSKKYLSVAQVAKRLGVSTETVYNYCKRGLLGGQYIKNNIKGTWKIDLESLELLEKELNKSLQIFVKDKQHVLKASTEKFLNIDLLGKFKENFTNEINKDDIIALILIGADIQLWLNKEQEFLGFYLSSHPLDRYKDILTTFSIKFFEIGAVPFATLSIKVKCKSIFFAKPLKLSLCFNLILFKVFPKLIKIPPLLYYYTDTL